MNDNICPGKRPGPLLILKGRPACLSRDKPCSLGWLQRFGLCTNHAFLLVAAALPHEEDAVLKNIDRYNMFADCLKCIL